MALWSMQHSFHRGECAESSTIYTWWKFKSIVELLVMIAVDCQSVAFCQQRYRNFLYCFLQSMRQVLQPICYSTDTQPMVIPLAHAHAGHVFSPWMKKPAETKNSDVQEEVNLIVSFDELPKTPLIVWYNVGGCKSSRSLMIWSNVVQPQSW